MTAKIDAGSAPDAPPTDTQRRILAAALDLFADRGYAATSTAAIASRAAVAEKTIFANFTSKERLFDQILQPAVLDLLLPRAIGGVRETLAKPWTSLPAFLGALMRNRLELVRDNPAKLKLIAQAVILHPEIFARFAAIFREQLEPRVASLLAELEARGELRAVPRASLMRIVLSVTAGYMLARFVLRPGSEWDDEAELATMIDVLVNGLKPNAREP